MATTTYKTFTANQGLLVDNGGGWDCTGSTSSCTQDVSGDSYGPINITGGLREMALIANIGLANNEFAGATSMAYTIKWHAMTTPQNGITLQIPIMTAVGPSDTFSDFIQYSFNDTSATHSGTFAYRPTSIFLRIGAFVRNTSGTNQTLAFADLSFEIHDVLYGAASTNETLSAPGSSETSLSSNSSTSVATNSITFLPSYTTSQSLPDSTSSSISPGNTSMTVAERAGVIAGALIGAGIVLLAITFWYRRQRRRRMLHLEQLPSDDGTSPDTRMPSQYHQHEFCACWARSSRDGWDRVDEAKKAKPGEKRRRWKYHSYTQPSTSSLLSAQSQNDNKDPVILSIDQEDQALVTRSSKGPRPASLPLHTIFIHAYIGLLGLLREGEG